MGNAHFEDKNNKLCLIGRAYFYLILFRIPDSWTRVGVVDPEPITHAQPGT